MADTEYLVKLSFLVKRQVDLVLKMRLTESAKMALVHGSEPKDRLTKPKLTLSLYGTTKLVYIKLYYLASHSVSRGNFAPPDIQ